MVFCDIHVNGFLDAMQQLLRRLHNISNKQPPPAFQWDRDYEYKDILNGIDETEPPRFANQFGLLEFDSPICAPLVS